MSYPLRLPDHLDAEARERAARIGISFNAFICVCVDAYLRGGPVAQLVDREPAAPARVVPASHAVGASAAVTPVARDVAPPSVPGQSRGERRRAEKEQRRIEAEQERDRQIKAALGL